MTHIVDTELQPLKNVHLLVNCFKIIAMKKIIFSFIILLVSILVHFNIEAACVTCSQPEKNDGYCVDYICVCDEPIGGALICLTGATNLEECEQFG